MRIDSNISQVMKQMERLIINVPAATKRVLMHEQWKPKAADIAEKHLNSIASPAEQKWVPGFLKTLQSAPLGEGTGEGFSLTMSAPREGNEGGARATEASENNRIAGLDFSENQTLGDLVRLWVETPFTSRDDPASGKDIKAEEGGKDFNKSDDEITRDLMWILTGAEASPTVNAARASLLPRLQAFMKATMANQLPPETVDRWLREVLVLWAEMVRRSFPAMLKQELHALKSEL